MMVHSTDKPEGQQRWEIAGLVGQPKITRAAAGDHREIAPLCQEHHMLSVHSRSCCYSTITLQCCDIRDLTSAGTLNIAAYALSY